MIRSLLLRFKCAFCILFCFVSFSSLQAQNAATSVKAGTITNTNNSGSGISWANTANVQAEDNIFATAYISGSNKSTNFLDATNWGFQTSNALAANYIPSNAQINGVQVSVKRRKTLSGSVRDVKVVLLKAGNETGTAKLITTAWPTTNASIAYGNEVDLWGASFTVNDLINSGFGVRIAAKNKGKKIAQAEIDYIKITVFYNQTIYYSKATGNLELLASWATAAGTQPANFTRDGQVFILNRTGTTTLTGNLTISGTNSSFIVGNGAATTLAIPSTFTLTANTSLKDNASLTISNTIIPAISSIGTGTTVTYNAAADQVIADVSYYNLVFGGSGNKSFIPNATSTTTISNNLSIGSGVTVNNQGNNIVINGGSITNNGLAIGTGAYMLSVHDVNATISGKGIFTNLELDATSSNNSASTVTLSNLTAITGSLYLNSGTFTNGANLTMEPGSVMKLEEGTLANTLSSTGYDVTYMSSPNSAITAGNELTGTVKNVNIQLASDATLSLSKNLAVTGSVIVSSGTLDVSNNNYSLTVGGDLINNGILNLRNNTVVLNGSDLQTIGGSGAVAFNNLTVNKATGIVQLNKPVTVANILTLTNGVVSTSSNNSLTMGTNATWTGGGSNSFINGPMAVTVNSLNANKIFPIGKNNAYRPVTLSITQKATTPTLYTAEVLATMPPVRSFSTGIQNVSSVRYYALNASNAANISNVAVTISYDADDEVASPTALRIANAEGAQWLNAGGSGTASTTGTITSGPLTALGDFVLANVKSIALPLTWVSFNATKKFTVVELSWQTAQEVNTKNFIIEKSSNGQTWSSIGTANSNNMPGGHSYSFTDASPLSVNYYRVKQVDIDGQFTYSKTIRVLFTESSSELVISPNVIRNAFIKCVIKDQELLKRSQVTVGIYDYAGNRVYVTQVKPLPVLTLSHHALPSGQYTIFIGSENKYQQAKVLLQ